MDLVRTGGLVTCASSGTTRMFTIGVDCHARHHRPFHRLGAFRSFWDNASAHHHLTDTPPRLANLLAACETSGQPERVLQFVFES